MVGQYFRHQQPLKLDGSKNRWKLDGSKNGWKLAA
jgi:hypothetical protein